MGDGLLGGLPRPGQLPSSRCASCGNIFTPLSLAEAGGLCTPCRKQVVNTARRRDRQQAEAVRRLAMAQGDSGPVKVELRLVALREAVHTAMAILGGANGCPRCRGALQVLQGQDATAGGQHRAGPP